MALESNQHTHKIKNSSNLKFSGLDWLVSANKATSVNVIKIAEFPAWAQW